MEAQNKSPYFSILVDGLTDVTATEQIIYILYLTETGETSRTFLQTTDIPNATAEALRKNSIEVHQKMCVKDFHTKLVDICCDDTSVK